MGTWSVDPDISKSSTLPSSFYVSDSFFQKVKNDIFSRSWQFVGDTDLLKGQTSTYPLNLMEGYLNEPIVLTKDKKERIVCLSNVCTHRGNLVCTHPGSATHLVCNYHGRKFNLEGKVEFMPGFDKVNGFPSAQDHLTQIQLNSWHQFLMVSLDAAFDFEEVAGVMDQRIGFMPFEKFILKAESSREYLVKAHWALYCDNYLEGFHIPFVHQGLNAVLDPKNYKTILFEHCNLQIGYARPGTEVFELPEEHPDYGQEIGAYYFWVFPNLLFNFYPWGLSINLVTPLDKETCKVRFLTYVLDQTKMDHSAGAHLDKVEREDEAVVESVQRGIRSRFYRSGRFSPSKEKGVHHFHQLISRYLGE